MADPTAAFAKLVPGFDFLQGLVKNAGAALPSIGQWVAPTLNPEELEKRIEELRTVQFWLEQNARMLGATIQALEVQRMTLSTLKTMNVSLGDLTDSLKIRLPDAEPAGGSASESAEQDADEADRAPPPAARKAAARKPRAAAPTVPPGVPDPMQWWNALTKQFTELAANAMKDGATDAARNLAGAMVKQSFDAASDTLKKAAGMPAAVAKTAASVAQNAAQSVAHAAQAAQGGQATQRALRERAAPAPSPAGDGGNAPAAAKRARSGATPARKRAAARR